MRVVGGPSRRLVPSSCSWRRKRRTCRPGWGHQLPDGAGSRDALGSYQQLLVVSPVLSVPTPKLLPSSVTWARFPKPQVPAGSFSQSVCMHAVGGPAQPGDPMRARHMPRPCSCPQCGGWGRAGGPHGPGPGWQPSLGRLARGWSRWGAVPRPVW